MRCRMENPHKAYYMENVRLEQTPCILRVHFPKTVAPWRNRLRVLVFMQGIHGVTSLFYYLG